MSVYIEGYLAILRDSLSFSFQNHAPPHLRERGREGGRERGGGERERAGERGGERANDRERAGEKGESVCVSERERVSQGFSSQNHAPPNVL